MTDTQIIEDVLANFEKICEVPHPSGHTGEIAKFFDSWAKEHGFESEIDEAGNVIIDIPANNGDDDDASILLQTHMDMVCVGAPGRNYNPLKDGIKLVRDGNILRADGTSMGADDGICSALIMSIATSNLPHGRLRWIATKDEETDMSGAASLAKEKLDGIKYLLNIDSEDYDIVTISCAAGYNVQITKKYDSCAPEKNSAVKIELSGLKGGHSGSLIQLGRLNGIKLTAAVLTELKGQGIDFELAKVKGGQAVNAIPSNATAVICVDREDIEKVSRACTEVQDRYNKNFADIEGGLVIKADRTDLPEKVISKDEISNLLNLIMSMFNGVYSFSEEMPEFVETSSNVGLITVTGDGARLEFLMRSSVDASMEEMKSNLKNVALAYGFNFDGSNVAMAWPIRKNNILLDRLQKSFKLVTGKEMKVTATHAGLECGAFIAKKPDLHAVSIGPTVNDPHSPQEVCELDTIPLIYNTIADIIRELK